MPITGQPSTSVPGVRTGSVITISENSPVLSTFFFFLFRHIVNIEPNLYGFRQSNINQLLANKPGRTGFGADLKCTLCKIYRCSEEDL